MAGNETIAYHYDDKGYYTGEMNRQLDPLTSELEGHNVYLMPGDCTDIKPPKEKEGFKIKWNKDAGKWEYEEVPVEEEPKPYEPTERDILNEKLWKVDSELRELDYIGIKIATGRATAEEYSEQIARMNELAEEKNRLKAEIAALEE